jgi:hypothetical protein
VGRRLSPTSSLAMSNSLLLSGRPPDEDARCPVGVQIVALHQDADGLPDQGTSSHTDAELVDVLRRHGHGGVCGEPRPPSRPPVVTGDVPAADPLLLPGGVDAGPFTELGLHLSPSTGHSSLAAGVSMRPPRRATAMPAASQPDMRSMVARTRWCIAPAAPGSQRRSRASPAYSRHSHQARPRRLVGTTATSIRASRIASLARSGRIQSSPAVAVWPSLKTG